MRVGGVMKVLIFERFYRLNLLNILILSFVITFIADNQHAYGAGAPRKSSYKSKAKYDVREKANVYFNLGKKFQKEGNFQEASKKYWKAVQIDPSYAEAHSNLGFAYRKLGEFHKAVGSYKTAIRLKPKLAEAHEYLGEAYAELGKFDLAERELKILHDLGSAEADELEEFIAQMKAK
jgi:tetratricopeptide (TPR) repeat protein